ncbi:MAG: hypothetical protein EOP62_22375 [Sphingomonadales bacterium]|nr:MAG: hypothetical protein EOP62_22375 [Sphingomonadales bacterium]
MLTTISRGKAGRVAIPGSDESLSWRDVFRRNEDLLTGALFSRMRFLSPHGVQQVMALLLGQAQATTLGDLESIEFWPRLDKLPGRKWVEPDVLMRFSEAYVLVELKPPFGGGQSIKQWKAEVDALAAEGELGEAGDPSALHFVALGNTGCRDGELELPFELPEGIEMTVHAREWGPISRAVPQLAETSKGGDAAVFSDWLEAFALFGLEDQPPIEWLTIVSWMDDKALSLDEARSTYESFKTALLLRPRFSEHVERWCDLVSFSQQHTMELPQWK